MKTKIKYLVEIKFQYKTFSFGLDSAVENGLVLDLEQPEAVSPLQYKNLNINLLNIRFTIQYLPLE
jgi:hypothetical protein